MAHSYEELKALSDQEIVELYNLSASQAAVGLAYYRDELHRRAMDKEAETTRSLTKWALVVSIISAVAAIAAVVLTVLTLTAS